MAVAAEVTHVELPLVLKPEAIEKVRFSGDMGRITLPHGENRDLHFYLMDLRIKVNIQD